MPRIVVVLAVVACSRSQGVQDDQLGGLVVEAKPAAKIDIELAAKDPAELSRALATPYGVVVTAIGPHSAVIDSKTIVEESGKPISELADHAAIENADRGGFHGVYTNSADYGREAIYVPPAANSGSAVAGALYLRPRYQRWHGRAPEVPDEPATIRDQYFAAIAAMWDLLAPGAELADRGSTQVAGRSGRKIEVRLAATPRDNPREELSQRRWRESRAVQGVAGELILDAVSGVPLAAKLSGSVAFSRDGRRFVMKLELDASVTQLGAVAVAAPNPAEVVATPVRSHEVEERDYLLHDIAPMSGAKRRGGDPDDLPGGAGRSAVESTGAKHRRGDPGATP